MSKTATLKATKKLVFKTNYRLMKVESIAECSKGSVLQYFQPFIKLPFVFKTFLLSNFEWPIKTGFTVHVHTWMKIFRIIPEFRIFRLTFHKKLATKH